MTCSTRLPNIPRPDASDVSPPAVTARDRLPEHVRASEGADVRADDGLRTRNLLLGLQLGLIAKDEERVSTLSSTPSRIRTDALLIESQGSLATRRWEQEPSQSATGDYRTCGSPGRHTIDPPPPWDAVPIRVSPALLRTHSPKASELQHGSPVLPGFASPGTSARSGGTLTVRQHGLRQVSWHARRDSNPHRQRFMPEGFSLVLSQ